MKKDYEIPSVPTNNIDLNDLTGLDNLAGWIARYHNFGLIVDEVSPHVKELLDEGILASFDPTSLTGLKAGYCGGAEEYERYEFSIKIGDFVNLNGYDWVTLHFVFKANKCMMFVECCNQSKVDKITPALENIFNAIGVEPLLEKESSRDITWQEADEIILKYLKYIKSPNIPSVPK